MSVTSELVTMRKVGGFTRVYPIGGVPVAPAYPYVVVGYSPNAPVERNMLGGGDPVRRFTVQHFGRTADGVEEQSSITFATFDGKSISGDVCSQELATAVNRDADDGGVLTTTHTYRF